MNPPLFSDLDLSRRLERAEEHANARFVEARARNFPGSGAEWIEVAGTYAMSIFGGVGLQAGACTIPEFRNQGAQFALMDYRLRYVAQQGCEVAMMCALPGSSSQRNVERHGFRIAYTRVKWHLERKS